MSLLPAPRLGSVTHVLGNSLYVPSLFGGITFVGLLIVWRQPDLIVDLAVPSIRPFTVQHLYSIPAHILVQFNVLAWLLNWAYVLLACVLVSETLSESQQGGVVLAGLVVGAVTFELRGFGERFYGSGMAVSGLVGSVIFYGLWRWRTLPRRWKVFVALSTFSMCANLLEGTPATQGGFMAAASGGILTFHWATTVAWSGAEGAAWPGPSSTEDDP
jgi:hypothetical protein